MERGMKVRAPQAQRGGTGCIVTFSPCPPAQRLEPEWRELETESAGSVFLSWPWIGSMLTAMGPNSLLVRVSHGERTIGLGLVGIQGRRRFALRPPALHLNETGNPVHDRIMTEYNGLLTLPGREDEAAEAVLAAIRDSAELGRRNLYLSGVPGQWREICRRQGLATRLLRPPQDAPYALLQTGPAGDLPSAMTRNSRQQIRRSLRYYEQHHPLALERAENAAQALEWLDGLEVLHTRSWLRRGKGGAFSDPSFKTFHRRLILANFAEGVPDILRVRTGDAILGYLYNLRWRGVASSYQSGFDFGDDARARPGLVAHVLAMRLYRAEGLSAYRFLAGDARYKTSLTTHSDPLVWMVAHRPGMARWLGETADRVLSAIGARM